MARVPRLRPLAFKVALRLEGGWIWSATGRSLLKEFYDVEVGMYSYGPCLRPLGLPPGTRVGNYCSLAAGITALRRNHPVDHLSQHPFFFNSRLGVLSEDLIEAVHENPLSIGHDVWIGQNVLITPGCRKIGNGSIIAAGAVVTRDVAPFSIVAGVPARLVRFRMSEEIQMLVGGTEWWLCPMADLVGFGRFFLGELTLESAREFHTAWLARSK